VKAVELGSFHEAQKVHMLDVWGVPEKPGISTGRRAGRRKEAASSASRKDEGVLRVCDGPVDYRGVIP
jgi:hypothetical protein